MTSRLAARRVLVVEDEYLLADDLRQELADAGALVVGPAPSVAQALELLEAERELDAAVLDINLRGETVFPVADALTARGIPFLFTTGYDAGIIPARFAAATCCSKPIAMSRIVAAVESMLRQ